MSAQDQGIAAMKDVVSAVGSGIAAAACLMAAHEANTRDPSDIRIMWYIFGCVASIMHAVPAGYRAFCKRSTPVTDRTARLTTAEERLLPHDDGDEVSPV